MIMGVPRESEGADGWPGPKGAAEWSAYLGQSRNLASYLRETVAVEGTALTVELLLNGSLMLHDEAISHHGRCRDGLMVVDYLTPRL